MLLYIFLPFVQSGLTQACLDSPHTTKFVADKVLEYIKKWVPVQRTGVLAGNSVHVDRMFLAAEMPAVIDWLHYRFVIFLSFYTIKKNLVTNPMLNVKHCR